MIGQTLGSYRIVEQIGMGGMATVYKAYDPDTDRYVALKILPQHFSQDPAFRERFQREAKAIARLEHLHILPIFTYGEEDGVAYMAMRYLAAGSLTDLLKQGALPLAEASRLLSQIGGALDHAHAHNILHRDVKPSNILLDAENNAFLMDFGIAKMVEATLDLTAGGILGTPAYMSPEQCQGHKELTPASDIYALGIVLYEMVTGHTPFQAETPIALIHMQLNEPLPLPHSLRPDLPEAAERVILKALAKAPESRYQTCQAMADAFAQGIGLTIPTRLQPAMNQTTLPDLKPKQTTAPALEEATQLQAVTKPTVTPSDRSRRWPRWVWALAAVLVVILIGVGLLLSVLMPSESDPTLSGIDPEEPLVNGVRVVTLCEWDGLGSGLCIFSEAVDEPVKILENVPLELSGLPSWSPDGLQVTFSALEQGENEDWDHNLYLVNVDGRDLVELPSLGNDLSPAWSPDGIWLAFHSSGNLGLIHPDGSEAKIIWKSRGDLCVNEPQWSADSQWLVVMMQVEGCDWIFPMTREVWVISRDGQVNTTLAAVTVDSDECSLTDVAFSPDGSQVAYFDGACQPHLIAVDSSSQPAPVNEFPYEWMGGTFPQWSD